MTDILDANWSEIDASNNAASPAGWPEGMQPSGVNNSARADKGGVKRAFDRIMPIKTTAGSSTVYTLTYDQAQTVYYDGEIHSFVMNAACGAAPTLNINGLGARQIQLFGGNLLPGCLLAGQVVSARYNLANLSFDIIPQDGGWVRLGVVDASAASVVDFTGIPAGVKHLQCVLNLQPSTNTISMNLRTYGADGVLDTGAFDYYWAGNQTTSTGANSAAGSSGASAISMVAATNVGNLAVGFGSAFTAMDIQSLTHTKFVTQSTYFNAANTDFINVNIGGARAEPDRITGVRVYPSGGTVTGKVTLFASA